VKAELTLVTDPAVIEAADDPGATVIRLCQHAAALLREALEHDDIDQIVKLRSGAEAISVCTRQMQLGKEAVLAATEIVRRAERDLGLAIRKGQEEGTIAVRGGAHGTKHGDTVFGPRPVTDFATYGELNGTSSTAGIYAMTDGVSDEDFDTAITDAKAEGNLSRANVVRKARHQTPADGDGETIPDPADRSSPAAARRAELIGQWAGRGATSRQIAAQLGIRDDVVRRIARDHSISIRADEVMGRTRRLDSNRIVQETVTALEGLVMGSALIEPAELDTTRLAGWAASMAASLRSLSQLAKTLKKEKTDDQAQ
jgi:hypothetical protein